MYPSVFSGTIYKGPGGLQCHKMHIKEAGLGRALPALIESGILQRKHKNMYLVSTWPFPSGTLNRSVSYNISYKLLPRALEPIHDLVCISLLSSCFLTNVGRTLQPASSFALVALPPLPPSDYKMVESRDQSEFQVDTDVGQDYGNHTRLLKVLFLCIRDHAQHHTWVIPFIGLPLHERIPCL